MPLFSPKHSYKVFIALFLAAISVLTVWQVHARVLAQRLQNKAALAQSKVRSWAEEGRDPSEVLSILDQVKPALDEGNPHQAEVLLDRALILLNGANHSAEDRSPLPVYAVKEEESDLYLNPRPVTIDGYHGSAMEPFLSPDAHYLFFNNENDPKIDTNLHFATRTGKLSFHYEGELPGVNSRVLDAAASLDTSGHFYFTSVRDYDRSRNSLFTGMFNGKAVTQLHPVTGQISPSATGAINMDVGISPDGQTLYISRAVIFPGSPAPRKSELIFATLSDGAFHIAPDTAAIMRNVNTNALQYAPCISADGLELYFTRASQPRPGPSVPGALRIMISTRNSIHEPFGTARTLAALSGVVEAPTLSLDRKELLFHKRVGSTFVVFRAERRPASLPPD